MTHYQQIESDAERDQILAMRDLKIMRIHNEEVRRDLCALLLCIVAACESSPALRSPSRREATLMKRRGEVKI